MTHERAEREAKERLEAKVNPPVTTRDMFAMAAMQGMVASESCSIKLDYIATEAYKLADAMLAARKL